MNILQFPRGHGRLPGHSRAANSTNVSDVMPLDRALSVDRIADHLSAGILSRCHHLETVGARAETSEAKASFEGHSSITSLKERKSAIAAVLGPFVLKCKDILALDGEKSLGHTVPMADQDVKAEYEQEFIARVKAARIATGKKQWQVAELMGIKQDQYKHYETGRVIPHHLIGRFCLICSIDPAWLLTGKGSKPLQATHVVEREPEPIPKPKRAKRHKAA